MKWSDVVGLVIVLALAIGVGWADMPDAPDWFPYRLESQRHILADMAELAARLGSPVTYERRGTVVAIDTFENGLSGWNSNTFGTGAEVKTVSYPVYSGGFAANITAGADGSKQASIAKNFPLIELSETGVEIAFLPVSESYRLRVVIFEYNGVTRSESVIRLDLDTQKIEYLDSSDTFVEIADLPDFRAYTAEWHKLKLVTDLDGREYVRVFLDNNEYDLSGTGLYAPADTTIPYVQVNIISNSLAGENSGFNVDDFIMTIEEP